MVGIYICTQGLRFAMELELIGLLIVKLVLHRLFVFTSFVFGLVRSSFFVHRALIQVGFGDEHMGRWVA